MKSCTITTRGSVVAAAGTTNGGATLLSAIVPSEAKPGVAAAPKTIDGLRIAEADSRGPWAAARAGYHGSIPPRYRSDTWDRRFRTELGAALRPGLDVLDVGAGARPVIAAGERPPDTTYVGLDLSAAELAKAPAGSYDRAVVGDVTVALPELRGGFDLILSWMVLEHVDSVPAALANLRAYARPGARLIAQMPGAFSLAALANRVIPASVARRFLRQTQGREADEVFPARYDRCWYSALTPLLEADWDRPTVTPLYTGVFYLGHSPLLRAAYLGYEEVVERRGLRNLAPYYLLTATAPRPPEPTAR
jgi:2-polyprenyl-6-hydroxyphenyl methylase/3-demethylubiquinone-9 3-methyltransferase